jgi:hypothetical protein
MPDFNEIYSHWHESNMLHWDLQDFKPSDIYEYSYYDQFALTLFPARPDTYLFSVRCRYRIFDNSHLALFSSMLESEFMLWKDDCTIDNLLTCSKEARQLYSREYNTKKQKAILQDIPIHFSDTEANRDPLLEILRGNGLL